MPAPPPPPPPPPPPMPGAAGGKEIEESQYVQHSLTVNRAASSSSASTFEHALATTREPSERKSTFSLPHSQ